MDVENYPMLGDAPVPLFSVGAMSPGPFASSPMSPDSASPLGFDYGSLSPIYGREHYYGSPGYGSGYSSPDCGYSPPFSPPPPGTAHVHPGFAQGYNSAQIQSSAGHFCGRMAGWDFLI